MPAVRPPHGKISRVPFPRPLADLPDCSPAPGCPAGPEWHPALCDGVVSLADGPVERADGLFGAPGEQVARRLEREHQPLNALQQRVVQFAGDTQSLVNAPLEVRVEFARDL